MFENKIRCLKISLVGMLLCFFVATVVVGNYSAKDTQRKKEAEAKFSHTHTRVLEIFPATKLLEIQPGQNIQRGDGRYVRPHCYIASSEIVLGSAQRFVQIIHIYDEQLLLNNFTSSSQINSKGVYAYFSNGEVVVIYELTPDELANLNLTSVYAVNYIIKISHSFPSRAQCNLVGY